QTTTTAATTTTTTTTVAPTTTTAAPIPADPTTTTTATTTTTTPTTVAPTTTTEAETTTTTASPIPAAPTTTPTTAAATTTTTPTTVSYSQIYVNQNGHLTFDYPWSSFSPQRFPMYGTRDVIAPFWTDLDNRENGEIYYVQYTNGSLLQQVTQDINAYFPALNFQASWVFIATWHEVAYFPTTGTQTTFQAVLTTDGHYSFVLMNYGSIASTPIICIFQAGYDTINSTHHFTIPGSFSSNATGPNSAFSLNSNVNVPGRWAFRVDHGSRGCTFNGRSKNSPINAEFNIFINCSITICKFHGNKGKLQSVNHGITIGLLRVLNPKQFFS
uniref:NIDO domain-containing protein n=1 Tax=Poecilia latipinna TaxID=48699 RepID=A0A3B3TXN5_9TELE